MVLAAMKSSKLNGPLSAIVKSANTTLITEGKLDAAGDFFTPDYVVHVTAQDIAGGQGTVRNVLGPLKRAFPDVTVEVEILIEGTERVAWQRTLKGTQKGAYKGFPASGQLVVWRDMVTSQFRGGLIAEEWVVTDLAERLLLSRKR
jgi:steroid delta-isomerase-like uncharacterized protein